MAEVGLLPFARIALQASKAVLPRCRSRFSKHQFTQPQPDALRGLDLSRSQSAARRTSRIASGNRTRQRARFHHAVSFLAAVGRPDHRPSGRRDGASVARHSSKRPAMGIPRSAVSISSAGLGSNANNKGDSVGEGLSILRLPAMRLEGRTGRVRIPWLSFAASDCASFRIQT